MEYLKRLGKNLEKKARERLEDQDNLIQAVWEGIIPTSEEEKRRRAKARKEKRVEEEKRRKAEEEEDEE